MDKEIIEVGFMPDATIYGMDNRKPTNGNGNGHHPNGNGDVWNCTVGQQSFIKRIVNENNLNKDDVEATAQQLFGVGVKQLDRMQASQLIEELLEKTGKKVQRSRWQRPQPART